MPSILARRLLWAATALVALVGVGVVATPASAASYSKLSLASLAFQSERVDATGEWTVVPLTWTVRNGDRQADNLRGTVMLRQSGGAPNSYVGQTYELTYEFGDTNYSRADFVSGTPQRSTYVYHFVVPRYSAGASARWVVTRVTAFDNRGGTLTVEGSALNRYRGRLTATTLVDRTPPTTDSLDLTLPTKERPYAYVRDTVSGLNYDTTVTDTETGFWKGTITLTGPAGQKVSGDFDAKWFEGDNPRCGRVSGGDVNQVSCGPTVLLPAGTAPGVWRVSDVELVDNAGNRGSVGGLATTPITVTSNDVVSASDFAVDPNPVNNWTQNVPTTVRMRVSGAQGGVAAIHLDFDWPRCRQTGTVPTAGADGTLSVPVLMFQGSDDCTVTGLAIVDNAGNIALYGEDYEAPNPGLTVARLPNTTPPTAANFTLTPTTVRESEVLIARMRLTMEVTAPIAPLASHDLSVFDSAGNEYTIGGGAAIPDPDGVLTLYSYLPYGLGVGTYTFGFRLVDYSGLVSYYGMPGRPGNHDLPEGALRFTVTAG